MSSDQSQFEFIFEPPKPRDLMSPEELFEQANEAMLRSLFEDRRFEAKPNSYSPKAIGEYISMWANTSPSGGLLAIGIRNDKIFEGCRCKSPNDLNVIEKSPDQFCPDAQWKVKRVDIHRDHDNDPDFVLLFLIYYHENRVVRTSDGRAFVRKGDSKIELKTPEEIRLLQIDKGEVSFETESVNLVYPDDFDSQSISTFAEGVREKKNWDQQHSVESILELMHLGKFNRSIFIPNAACALLFAKDPRQTVAGCRVRFLRFEGEAEGSGEKWNAVKDEFIDGTVPNQIFQVADILRSQLRTFSRLGKDGKFLTSPEYPEPAWYEAVVNACVHRAYSNGLGNRPIFVKMFDDRLVIESPGSFPPFVTPENIYDTHHPRNPFLMEAMYYLKFVKCAHEGTRRIRATMLEMSLPKPEFKRQEVDGVGVRVTLRNNIHQRKIWVDSDVAALLGASLAQQLTSDEKRCLNYIAEYGEISVSDTQRLTGKTWPASKKMLMGLVNQGILHHEHRDDIDRDTRAKFRLKNPDLARND